MAAVGGARERPVGTRVGVVAASSDVIRLLPAKTSVSCAVLLQGCAVTAQDNRCLSELDSLDSLCASADRGDEPVQGRRCILRRLPGR